MPKPSQKQIRCCEINSTGTIAFFLKQAAQVGLAFIPWPPKLAPDELFCFQYQRTVRNDNTISFDKALLQIPPEKHRTHYAKATLELCQHLDCALSAHYHGK